MDSSRLTVEMDSSAARRTEEWLKEQLERREDDSKV
jgi:hypothetical protein